MRTLNQQEIQAISGGENIYWAALEQNYAKNPVATVLFAPFIVVAIAILRPLITFGN